MKFSPLILCLLTTSSLLFSQEPLSELPSSLEKSLKKTKREISMPLNKGFFYLKSGATSGVLSSDPNLLLGIGYRSKLFGNIFAKSLGKYIAFDMNFQFSEKQYYKYRSTEVYLPKINGLFFLTPKNEKSFYLGGGFALAISDPAYIVVEKDYQEQNIQKGQIFASKDFFIGSTMTFILGYDVSLHQKYMNCFQIEFNLPITPDESQFHYYDDYSDHWTINLSYLLGF